MDGRVFILMANNTFIKINGDSQSSVFSTQGLFNPHAKPVDSPIDMFVKRNRTLIVKMGNFTTAGLLDESNEDDRDVFNLFLLGFISNVESYFRSIIRETINIDTNSYKTCLNRELTFAAAMHHNKSFLPEALLEKTTFISRANISNATKDFLGVSLKSSDQQSKEVRACLDDFESLCQLRHCIVHRAGLLGSQNAVKLGIEEHKNYFEQPITLDSSFLQSAAVTCLNAVRTSNNYLFNSMVDGYLTRNTVTWKFPSDKKWFVPYFSLYQSKLLDQEMINAGITPYGSFGTYKHFRDSHTSC